MGRHVAHPPTRLIMTEPSGYVALGHLAPLLRPSAYSSPPKPDGVVSLTRNNADTWTCESDIPSDYKHRLASNTHGRHAEHTAWRVWGGIEAAKYVRTGQKSQNSCRFYCRFYYDYLTCLFSDQHPSRVVRGGLHGRDEPAAVVADFPRGGVHLRLRGRRRINFFPFSFGMRF